MAKKSDPKRFMWSPDDLVFGENDMDERNKARDKAKAEGNGGDKVKDDGKQDSTEDT